MQMIDLSTALIRGRKVVANLSSGCKYALLEGICRAQVSNEPHQINIYQPLLVQFLQSFQGVPRTLIVAGSRFDHDEFSLRVDLNLIRPSKKYVNLTWGGFDIVEWSGSHSSDNAL
jgi:hypothetical protein